jgi:hypothetical protein
MPRPSVWDENRLVAPVTLPALQLPDINKEIIADEARAIAAGIAERRVIRAGRDAWEAIGKAETFEAWKAIGAARMKTLGARFYAARRCVAEA